jgi:hypothetical protein
MMQPGDRKKRRVQKVQMDFLGEKMGPKSPHYEEKRSLKVAIFGGYLPTTRQIKEGILKFSTRRL